MDGGAEKSKSASSLEPATAVGHPPRDEHDGNGRAESPPDWQEDIGEQAEHDEHQPEDLAFHGLDCKSLLGADEIDVAALDVSAG